MDKVSIDREELVREFTELAAIDSPSFEEREMADELTRRLRELGFSVREDDAAAKIGGNAGNLYAYRKGTLSGKPILLSGHMDTVEPSRGKRAVRHPDGRITSAGDTVLGADDLAGVTEILGAVRAVLRAGVPHRDLEIVFSPAEEAFTVGASAFDYSQVKAEEAFCLDVSGPVGTAAVAAPSLVSFTVTVHGRPAHAGFCPEDGINAIQIASKAVAGIRQGHIDETTTLNLGTIHGGTQRNIVPGECTITGEARSYNHEYLLRLVEEVRNIFEKAAEGTGAEVEFHRTIHLHAYEVPDSDRALRDFHKACEAQGIPFHTIRTFGGSDINQYRLHGIDGIVVSSGMTDSHTTHESLDEQDLVRGAKVLAWLITEGHL